MDEAKPQATAAAAVAADKQAGDGRQATGNYGKVQGVDVLEGKGVRAFAVQGATERIEAKWFPAENQPFAEYIQVKSKDSGGASVQPWDVQLRASNATAIKAGDTLLATIYFRTQWVPDETGEGQSEFVFEFAQDPWTKSATFGMRAGPEWKQLLVPFVAEGSYAPGEAQLAFRLGYSTPQVIEFGGIKLENFGTQLALADLPKTRMTYPGMALDAPWRAEAAARIEQNRKGDFSILVRDAAGAPVNNAAVSVALIKHAFALGTCLPAAAVVDNNEQLLNPTKELFNMVTLENDLKWTALSGKYGPSYSMERALAGLEWINQNGLRARGHVLVWPSWKETPTALKALKDNKPALRAAIEQHIRDVASATKGKVVHWDVLNEPYTNHDILDILGYDVMADWFRIAHQTDPGAKLFINDFAILNGGGGTTEHRDHYEKMIQLLVDANAPLDGIAFQGHFGESLTSPQDLMQLLNRYGKFGKSLLVTEYDITIEDEQLAADYTRDFFTVLFSHPQVEGIVMWGMWDGNHWRHNAPLFHKDWTPKPAYDVYKKLTQQDWVTREKGNTNAEGTFPVRGFYGEYDVTVVAAGKTKQVKAKLMDDGTEIVVQL